MARPARPPRIGLALGGGSARGFAHIPVLEAFDELGIVPDAIAGTSMGAVIGSAYAAGLSGAAIRAHIVNLFRTRSDFLSRIWQLRPRRLNEFVFGLGQLDLERALAIFMPKPMPADFAGLSIPFTAVATDYYAGEAAVLREGPLFTALAASAAIPMLFRPVTIGGRVMIDGGICNPVPFDLLADCDIVIAVDVLGGTNGTPGRTPGSLESVFAAAQLFQRSLLAEKLKGPRPPEILVRPPTNGFSMLDFSKASAIITACEPVKEEVKRRLDEALTGRRL